MKNSEILLRDPFILAYEGKYYMYGTRSHTCWGDSAVGFDVYVGDDLENWTEPIEVFHAPENFWASKNFWAPEVYFYKSAFFIFATFCDENGRRGTQILKAVSPLGPFKIHSPEPVTPPDWVCLDGTLYIDEMNKPYMVFAHEWKQIKDGSIAYIPLKEDLSGVDGEAHTIFHASSAPWVYELPNNPGCYVTDGPFMYKCRNGALLVLWSSIGETGYLQVYSVSESGDIKGPWVHCKKPLFKSDGGHGMLFKDSNNRLNLALHTPNLKYSEHPVFIPADEINSSIVINA